MRKRGFTLLELLTVIVIIGILATLGLVNYGPVKEKSLDKEATVNLKLVQAAQKIYRMETGFYYPHYASAPQQNPQTDVDIVNTNLKLLLPAETNRNWDYKVETDTASDFTTKFQRKLTTDQRVWCIDEATEEPYSCSW